MIFGVTCLSLRSDNPSDDGFGGRSADHCEHVVSFLEQVVLRSHGLDLKGQIIIILIMSIGLQNIHRARMRVKIDTIGDCAEKDLTIVQIS